MADSDNDSTIIFSNPDDDAARIASAAKEKNACLLGVGAELNHIVFELMPGCLTFGRGSNVTYCLQQEGISRRHFKIETDQSGKTASLSDLGSRNGTYLNNRRLQGRERLTKGDIIKFGVATLRYLPGGDPERLTYEKISREANRDPLTGCLNRVYFNQAADAGVCSARIYHRPLSVFLLDIDHFGRLNDSIGKAGGDFFLQELARVLGRLNQREGWLIGRLDEDSFAVLLPGMNLSNGFETAEIARKAVLQHEFRYDFRKWPVTVSIGLAEVVDEVTSGQLLLRLADRGISLAKEKGRNQVASVQDSL